MKQDEPKSDTAYKRKLIACEVEKTIKKLYQRIHDRFPNSGIEGVCLSLLEVSRESLHTIAWIGKPNYSVRVIMIILIILLAIAAVEGIISVPVSTNGLNIAEFVQMIDASISSILFIGGGIVFLITFETRRKRKRAIKAINQLRSIAHIIDAHQLTKDPDTLGPFSTSTQHSPKRRLGIYELGRYLDYCSEMLSLTGILGFLYIQDFDDHVANSAVNDLETLTTELSQKVCQKIMMIRSEN